MADREGVDVSTNGGEGRSPKTDRAVDSQKEKPAKGKDTQRQNSLSKAQKGKEKPRDSRPARDSPSAQGDDEGWEDIDESRDSLNGRGGEDGRKDSRENQLRRHSRGGGKGSKGAEQGGNFHRDDRQGQRQAGGMGRGQYHPSRGGFAPRPPGPHNAPPHAPPQGRFPPGPAPPRLPLNPPQQHRVVEVGTGDRTMRVLLLTHVQGRIGMINNLVRQTNANIVINAGNFGFFDAKSYDLMAPRDMRKRITSSHVYNLSEEERSRATSMSDPELARLLKDRLLFSELPHYLSGKRQLKVPVYTVWGQQEDIRVVEAFRKGEYSIENLFILDERTTHKIGDLRLLGLGGNVVYHKLFDTGSGQGTIAGEVGKMWTTLLQIGELLQTAKACYDPSETRLHVSYVSPGRDPLIAQIAHTIKADFSISGHLHSRYCVSLSDWAVQNYTDFCQRLETGTREIVGYWNTLKDEITRVCTKDEQELFRQAIAVVESVPSEGDYRGLWSISLADLDSGHAVLKVTGSRVGLETFSEGRDFGIKRRVDRRARDGPSTQTHAPATQDSQKPGAKGRGGGPGRPAVERRGSKEGRDNEPTVCRYFSKSGNCRMGDKCHFAHV